MLTSRQCNLLDNKRLVAQLVNLERRPAPSSGHDSVDHPSTGHDDVANAAAGALVGLVQGHRVRLLTAEELARLQAAADGTTVLRRKDQPFFRRYVLEAQPIDAKNRVGLNWPPVNPPPPPPPPSPRR